MKSEHIQRQIESMENTLRKAKNTGIVALDDPALCELERVVLMKHEELEIEKERERFLWECAFFADDDHQTEESGYSKYQTTRYR